MLRWKDARLAHTRNGIAHYALDQIWTPRVSTRMNQFSYRKLPESVEVEPDGTVSTGQRYVRSFTQPLRLHLSRSTGSLFVLVRCDSISA